MSKQDRRDQPRLALQPVASSAPVRRKGLAAQVDELRDAHGRARGWRVRLDNGTVAELDAEPAQDLPPRLH